MEYRVSLTPQAAEQIRQIIFYIAHILKEPETAKRWADFLRNELGKLSFMPSRHALTEEEPWHSRGVRKMIVKNFLVYYLIDEATHTVSVIAVIYGRRDQLAALSDMP